MPEAFPQHPEAKRRLLAQGIDVEASLREWLGALTGRDEVGVERLIAEGAEHARKIPLTERYYRKAA